MDESQMRGYVVCTTRIEALMKARIVRVGNSRGVRLPRPLLEHAGLPDDIEIRAEPGRIIIESARRARSGWAEAAAAMAEEGDDAPLDEPTPTEFDAEEWAW
jgi:antitoxin MazE